MPNILAAANSSERKHVCDFCHFGPRFQPWVNDIEQAKEMDDLPTSNSISGIATQDFEALDSKIASDFMNTTQGELRKRVGNDKETQKRSWLLIGRQFEWMTYERVKISDTDGRYRSVHLRLGPGTLRLTWSPLFDVFRKESLFTTRKVASPATNTQQILRNAQARALYPSGTSATSEQKEKSNARSVSARSTSKEVYFVRAKAAAVLVQLEHLEIEANAVTAGDVKHIGKKPDERRRANRQCCEPRVPKAGTDEVESLGVRGKKVFANLTNSYETLESLRSAVEVYLAKDLVDLQASPSCLLWIFKEREPGGLKLPRIVLAEVVSKDVLPLSLSPH